MNEQSYSSQILSIIIKARKETKSGNALKAEGLYKTALRLLKQACDNRYDILNKVNYLSTKAEYLCFTGLTMMNTKEDSLNIRAKFIEGIDIIEEAKGIVSKTNFKDTENFIAEKQAKLIKFIIDNFGCIIPKTKTHLTIKCPIRIDYVQKEANLGIGFSPGIIFQNPRCSICGKKFLDPECTHVPGKKYGDKITELIHDKLILDHVALVKQPKDKECRITRIHFPRNEANEKLLLKKTPQKNPNETPFICHLCREDHIDSTPKITYEIFSEMQKLDKHDKEKIGRDKIVLSGYILIWDKKVEATKK